MPTSWGEQLVMQPGHPLQTRLSHFGNRSVWLMRPLKNVADIDHEGHVLQRLQPLNGDTAIVVESPVRVIQMLKGVLCIEIRCPQLLIKLLYLAPWKWEQAGAAVHQWQPEKQIQTAGVCYITKLRNQSRQLVTRRASDENPGSEVVSFSLQLVRAGDQEQG